MTHGVSFTVNDVTKHSLDDFDLLMGEVNIQAPKVKTRYVEKTFGDGSIDLTEVDGNIYYEDREFTIPFSCNNKKKYDGTLSELLAFLHGRSVKMTFYFDDEYYYLGRAEFDEYESDKGLGTISLDVTCRPYKYKQTKESVTFTTATDAYETKTFESGRMPAVVTVTCNGAGYVKYGTQEIAVNNVSMTLPSVIFQKGANTIEFKGANLTWTVEYQIGEL